MALGFTEWRFLKENYFKGNAMWDFMGSASISFEMMDTPAGNIEVVRCDVSSTGDAGGIVTKGIIETDGAAIQPTPQGMTTVGALIKTQLGATYQISVTEWLPGLQFVQESGFQEFTGSGEWEWFTTNVEKITDEGRLCMIIGTFDPGTTFYAAAGFVIPGENQTYFNGDTIPNGRLDRTTWADMPMYSESIWETREFIEPEFPFDPTIPRVEDLLVEVRDKNLNRLASIPAPDLDIRIQPVFNGVGSWSINLPAEHRAVKYLRTPGSGIVVTNIKTGKVILSGPTSKPTSRATSADVRGMVTISGLSDEILLWISLGYPQPMNADVKTQNVTHDIRTGNAESVMRQYVAYNLTPQGLADRAVGLKSFVRLQATNAGQGTTVTGRSRFDYIGDLLVELARDGGGLGFRMVQVGKTIEFQIYTPTDRTKSIRLDVVNGTLAEQSVEVSPPAVTRVISGAQGEGIARKFYLTRTAATTAEELLWGLAIEQFKDDRDTDVESEVTTRALGILAEEGLTTVSVKAQPSDNQSMVYMKNFDLGDLVTVVVDGAETKSIVTESVIVADKDGLRTGVAIGDITDFDSGSALRKQVETNERRLDALERNTGLAIPTGIKVDDWNAARTPGENYWAYSGAANNPAPGSWMVGQTLPFGDPGGANERLVQILRVPHIVDGRVWRRYYNVSSGAWSSWVQEFSWNLLQDKPSTFAPSAHTHTAADLPGRVSKTITAASGWTLYFNHPSNTPAGTPWVTSIGGYAAVQLVARNTSGAAISAGGGVNIANGLPNSATGTFYSLDAYAPATSQPGPVLPDLGVFVSGGGALTIRGSRSIAANEFFNVMGVYPTAP